MLSVKKIVLALTPIVFLMSSHTTRTMTYDNKFIPLLPKPLLRDAGTCFWLRLQPILFTATDAFVGDLDDHSNLFAHNGQLYHNDLESALLLDKKIKTPFLRPDLEARSLHWLTRGRLDAGGLAAAWYFTLAPYLEFGGSFLLLAARSQLEAVLESARDANGLSTGDRRDAFDALGQATRANKLKGFLWSDGGIGDLDLYLRLGKQFYYTWRIKTIDTGVKLGVICPTGNTRDIDNPASIPFGGNGHWGIYGDWAVDTELKDDLFAGFDLRLIQRFSKRQEIRVPVHKEPNNFGVRKLFADVSPGITFAFSPYVGFGDIRDGFGVQLAYTLIMHAHDSFTTSTPAGINAVQSHNSGLELISSRSSWTSEYFTFSLLYDFAKNTECRGSLPRLSLDIDVPYSVFASERSFKTYAISLRIESDLW